MTNFTKPLALALSLFLTPLAHAAPSNRPPVQAVQQHRRHVDVVLALDTSSSMDGLIDGARQKLWDVVTTLSKAQPQPILRVGIVSYGNTGYDAQKGWVKQDIDLTSDLDSVYQRLFGLTTNGGDEYVARAVQVATSSMGWSQDQDALRIVFVAGNESAEQDPVVSLDKALGEARGKNIFVNTIYCGPASATETVGWAHAAALGKGKFAAVDQNRAVAIATPQDDELRRLSEQLNHTYIAYGASGGGRQANQAKQDKNASGLSAPAAAARAIGKASALYTADDWDVVDAVRDGKKIEEKDMPTELRAMPEPARADYVAKKAKERETLKSRIATLGKQRDAYIGEARRKSTSSTAGVDDALLDGIKSEAQSSGFKF